MKPTAPAGLFAALLVVLLSSAAAAASQAPQPSKWWTDETVRKELGLTQEQTKSLEDIFQAAVPIQKNLKKTLDEAEAQFERIANTGDKKAAAEQIHRVEAARAELKKSHSFMLLDMRYILTPSQWTRLGALWQATEKASVTARPAEPASPTSK